MTMRGLPCLNEPASQRRWGLQADAARRQDAEAAIDGSDAVPAPPAADADAPTPGADGQQAAPQPPPTGRPPTAGRLRNQFNFSERAAQSAVHPPRDRGTNTEPPPTAQTSGPPSTVTVNLIGGP
jgi:hypothetical protein